MNSVQTAAGTFTYTYDEVGNIKTVSDGTYTTSYDYDSLNQLVRENNQQIGKTYTFAYQNGNITERKEYAYTTGELGEVLDTKTWSYGNNTWGDLLTNFNGQTVTYDEIGNPLTIGNQTLSWNGRQLQSITDGENTYSYAYNIDGQRVSKTVNGVTTEYFYNGSILAGQKTGEDILTIMYDNNGNAFGFTYNGEEYYYAKNNQNDVVAIFDANGKLIGRYIYDAWGNCALRSTGTIVGGTIAFQGFAVLEANPIRYRSYYYDSETRLYYLNSRYYSPDMCRFLNADLYAQTGQGILDKNMFAYCLNNPVKFMDPIGLFVVSIPAEGAGSATVTVDENECVSVIRDGDTYIIEPISPSQVPTVTDIKPAPDHPNYKPPKGGPTRVKNPNGPGWGWKAKDDGVWVWTPNMHGGDGWTIQYPNGRHKHAYPNGGVRDHFQTEPTTADAPVMVFVGVVISAILIIDNITGVGVADDTLLAGSGACVVGGLHNMYGRRVCTECGEVIYGF